MIKKKIKKELADIQWFDPQKNDIAHSNAEYISFDIFDTLLKRDVPNPVDVFKLVEIISGESDFKNKRIEAERQARKRKGNGEVGLDEIYSEYPSAGYESLRNTEIGCEIKLSTVNKDMQKFYQECIACKKIVLISDMYLPREVIEKLLEKNGIDGYSRLFISCEVNKTKSNGTLFEHVCETMHIKPHDLIHIGNSFKADYYIPRRLGIKSYKIATYKCRTQRKYRDILCRKNFSKDLLDAFINNHTDSENEYFQFGYECFGPLLYGFVTWLFKDMKKNSVKQVFFMARDGFIMKRIYESLEFDKVIPDFYFEASRRSLRVPSYDERMTYEDFIDGLSVPNKTTIVQILDSFGLDYQKYGIVAEKCGFSENEQIKRDFLYDNDKFKNMFNMIHKNIIVNAKKEAHMLQEYLAQFDFSKKTAMVDIGWGGSMQKYLLGTLENMEVKNDICGYYVGLTHKARKNLGELSYRAKGYAFDNLNNPNGFDLERPFVGLFETLFLEQEGSVKRYTVSNKEIKAERYSYEYFSEGKLQKEAICVKQIQDGAVRFAKDFAKSINSKYVENDSNIYFSNLYQIGIAPSLGDVKRFGKFEFFNNGSKVYLANPQSITKYIIRPQKLMADLFDSQWKVGFLKALLKLDLPYLKIFNLLRHISK